MNRSVCFAAMLVAASAAHVPNSHASAPISKLQSRALPPDQVKARVFAQLEDFFLSTAGVSEREKREREDTLNRLLSVGVFAQPPVPRTKAEIHTALARVTEVLTVITTPWYASRHPKYPLHELSFVSRIYATDTPGLCVYYSVDVKFESVGRERGAATPTRATGVSVAQLFHFLHRPQSAVLASITPAERQATGRDCATLGNDDDFFVAHDEGEAVRSLFFLHTALRLIRDGGVTLDNQCELGNRPREECVSHLKQISNEYPFNVDCPPARPVCSILLLGADDTRLDIKLRDPARSEIEAITLRTVIIIHPHRPID